MLGKGREKGENIIGLSNYRTNQEEQTRDYRGVQREAKKDLAKSVRPNDTFGLENQSSKLSSGALNDLAYISLLFGLLTTIVDGENGKDVGSGLVLKEDYRTNKRINRRIETLLNKLKKVMRKYKDYQNVVLPRISKLIQEIDRLSKTEVQLDYLAIYVYLVRFYENEKAGEGWKVISEKEIYGLADLIGSTKVSTYEESMFKLAYDVASILK